MPPNDHSPPGEAIISDQTPSLSDAFNSMEIYRSRTVTKKHLEVIKWKMLRSPPAFKQISLIIIFKPYMSMRA
eukprot:c24919_g1_i2 orf=644-862(-)